MHKKKNKDSVLAGELILTFFKSGRKVNVNSNAIFKIDRTVGAILAEAGSGKIYGEYLLNRLVIEAWRKGAINSVNIKKEQITELLEKYGWNYDQRNHYWIKDGEPTRMLFED
jgi:hypothetical protein